MGEGQEMRCKRNVTAPQRRAHDTVMVRAAKKAQSKAITTKRSCCDHAEAVVCALECRRVVQIFGDSQQWILGGSAECAAHQRVA
jgi:hypothetical protein